MSTKPSTIIAIAAEDDRYAHVRRRAIERARATGATLVLFDVDARPSALESPLPTNWSGDGEEEQFGDRLSIQDLEAAGRRPIADQVREAQAAGVEAFGWLPEGAAADALRDYAARQQAELVLVPAGDEAFDGDVGAPVEVVSSEPAG
jgi:nucleotide-binding universal stress UspA family protein